MKTINAIVKEICKREGLKSQTSIANVREIVGIVSDLFFERGLNIYEVLWEAGQKRAKRKPKKKG